MSFETPSYSEKIRRKDSKLFKGMRNSKGSVKSI